MDELLYLVLMLFTDLIENPKIHADRQGKRIEHYFAFNIVTGQSTLNTIPGRLSIAFPYTSTSKGSMQFNDAINHSRIEFPIQTYSIGFEFGRTKGVFWGFNLSLFNSTLPSNKFWDNHSYEFKLGDNIRISDKLSFRPAILIDYNSLFVRSNQWIDNRHTDITALGHYFPYKRTTYSGKHRRTRTNDNLDVGFHEQVGLLKLQGELAYSASPGIRITLAVGFTENIMRNETLQLRGLSHEDIPLSSSGLNFTSTAPTNKIFDYNGLYWNLGVSFTFPLTKKYSN